MADTAEMIRLMRHAADLLDATNPTSNAHEVARLTVSTIDRMAAHDRAVAEVAATAMASAVLRMVAACMGDEPSSMPAAPEAVGVLNPEVATDG